jgi:hypothetical protein
MKIRSGLIAAVAVPVLLAGTAQAQPLQIVTVGAPAINCVYAPSCTVTPNDFTAALLQGGFLQSRVLQAQPGSAAAGMWGYLYRIDLRNATAPGSSRVTEFSIDFGPVVNTLDYNGDGARGEHVFVITSGGLGSVGPSAAVRNGNVVTFRFSQPVEAGQTSYFFGMTSRRQPHAVTARITSNVDPNISIEARAPQRGRAMPQRPERPERPVPPVQPAPIAAEDCISYNPRTLRIVDEGADGWLLTDGGSRMLMLDNQADAVRALALAQRHTAHCFIGRNNARPNRADYIRDYWTGSTGATTTIQDEDCVAYNPATVGVFDRGEIGWRMEDGAHWMLLYHDQADANRGLAVAQANAGRLCFIGRGNSRPERSRYITEYWK